MKAVVADSRSLSVDDLGKNLPNNIAEIIEKRAACIRTLFVADI